MIIPPWLVLALLISLALALAYQLASRRFGRRVFAYWLLALAAFLAAEVMAESQGWSFGRMGDLRLGVDIPAAVLIILLLWFLGV